jgi:hypothetical protein
VKPPGLGLLPEWRMIGGIFSSIALHAIAMAALLWLPRLFPAPIIIRSHFNRPSLAENIEPLPALRLPRLTESSVRDTPAPEKAPGKASAAVLPHIDLPLQPDYIGPQQIVSYAPNPVNRLQTILRPDLVKPPEMKFPLRLQSMVNLPAQAPPVLATPPVPEPAPMPAKPTKASAAEPVPNPALALVPKQVSLAPVDVTPIQPMPSVPVPAEPQAIAPKPVIVVSAVAVPPDPSVPIPDAQLAGHFVVGPEEPNGAIDKSSAADMGTHDVSRMSKRDAASPPSRSGAETIAEEGGKGENPKSRHEAGAAARTGNEVGSTAKAMKTANGLGGAAGVSSGAASGAGPAGSGATMGISISGASSGRTNAAIAKTIPLEHAYGMMIVSGGNNGGAGRDMGVFARSETVYSVTIPMADVGGSGCTMQYTLVHPPQAGAGLPTPPFAQKKVAAVMTKSGPAGDPEPVFITGIIDENGKLGSLRAIHAQDARSQPAMRALEQWEFLPAQLDGKPVAAKVLIGIAVVVN